VGNHTFAKIPSQIASFLKLPEASLYIGHCFRRSGATLLAVAGKVRVLCVAESVNNNKLEVANQVFYKSKISIEEKSKEPKEKHFLGELESASCFPVPTASTSASFNEKEVENYFENENLVLGNSSFSNCSIVFNI
jgi:hypothetical protein